MPFGYTGQNQPNQTVSNSGVFSITDVAELQSQGKLGGSLELIEEQTVSSAYADFTSLQESKYDVLVFQLINVKLNSTGNIAIRLSNDGGSSFIATNYQYAWQRGRSSGSFDEVKSTSRNRLIIAGDTDTTGSNNMYVYCYNFGNSSKYSFVTTHTILSDSTTTTTNFGGGVQPTAEVHNAVRFGSLDFNALASGTIKLYGVKQL